MKIRLLCLLVLVSSWSLLLGCGGGGGGGGGNPVGPPAATVLQGEIDTAAIHADKTPSLRAAANPLKLRARIVGLVGTAPEPQTLDNSGKFSFSITNDQLSDNALTFEIINAGNAVVMALMEKVPTSGGAHTLQKITATSTAIVMLRKVNSDFPLDAGNTTFYRDSTFISLVNSISDMLKASGAIATGGILAEPTVMNKAQTVAEQLGTLAAGEMRIREAYAEIMGIMTDNSMNDTQRVNKFMTFIGTDFTAINGDPAYNDLETSTRDRFERYTINNYDFAAQSFTVVASDTIKVTTHMFISVDRKPGASGGVVAATVTVTPTPVVTWKFNGERWKIKTGLPFKSSEIKI